jgi:hypothetical protein
MFLSPFASLFLRSSHQGYHEKTGHPVKKNPDPFPPSRDEQEIVIQIKNTNPNDLKPPSLSDRNGPEGAERFDDRGDEVMRFMFDHLVHLVHSPKAAMRAIRQSGIHAVEGGSHSDWGTANTLCYFDLSYIEFLGVENPAVAESARDNPLVRQALEDLATGEGPARIALRTDDLENAAKLLRDRGLSVAGPFPGSRTRPDGTVLRWSLLFPEHLAGELPSPFFIQWEQSDAERRTDLRERGAIAPHPAGDLRLDHIAFAVRDLDRRATEWEKWFGLKPGKEYVDRNLNAKCRELMLPGGNLLFCTPVGDGPVSEMLQTRGERPFLVTLAGADRHGEQRIFGGIYRFQI